MTDLPTLAGGGTLHTLLPRLVDFTHEDRAAKGLRVFGEDTSGPAVQFTAVEMVSMHRAQLLHAPRGGGKTTFARDLAAALSGAADAAYDLATLCRPAVRNAEGLTLPQVWDAGVPDVVLSAPGQGSAALAQARKMAQPLLILDGLEHEPAPVDWIATVMAWLAQTPQARLLVMCETVALESIRLHPDLRVHALLPLPAAERRRALDALGVADPVADAWIDPGPWALALRAGRPITPRDAVATGATDPWLDEARDAMLLETLPPTEIATRALQDPARWLGPLRLRGRHCAPDDALAQALAATGALPLMLAAAETVAEGGSVAAQIAAAIARTIATGRAAPALRRRAGRALARLGDPRDLERLVAIPAGDYLMGGDLHPNSAPEHRVTLDAFRIAVFPVTCAAYHRFVLDTGRSWTSAMGRQPERANHPATDLTWHEARAYCDWLTLQWRAGGQIAAHETVRLPTEREWEAAARGPGGLLYPWGDAWAAEHANDEETGFNDICAVGLFPEGAAPSGCLDIAGQVWEWCTTLWGADMTAPSFRFPWADDGREALDAALQIRRVLRGGCFSSGQAKANGVYRGSLEPDGFWRGNGFRIVVA